MSQKRLSMRRIRELLRLKHELGRSHREIAESLGIANSTVSAYVRRAAGAGMRATCTRPGRSASPTWCSSGRGGYGATWTAPLRDRLRRVGGTRSPDKDRRVGGRGETGRELRCQLRFTSSQVRLTSGASCR